VPFAGVAEKAVTALFRRWEARERFRLEFWVRDARVVQVGAKTCGFIESGDETRERSGSSDVSPAR
jgi:hypothetical protein